MVNGRHLSLRVTDVVMPDMNGSELYRRLKESYQVLKVLYTSGYTQTSLFTMAHSTKESTSSRGLLPFTTLSGRSKR